MRTSWGNKSSHIEDTTNKPQDDHNSKQNDYFQISSGVYPSYRRSYRSHSYQTSSGTKYHGQLDHSTLDEAYGRSASHDHLSEYDLSYQNNSGVQARAIVFVGSVTEPPKQKGFGELFISWAFRWQSLVILTWLLLSASCALIYLRYHLYWGKKSLSSEDGIDRRSASITGFSPVECEPLPLWTLTSAGAMVLLSALMIMLMCCEQSNLGGEVISIWLIGGGHCLVGLALFACFIWVCILGWVWTLESPSQCGPDMKFYALLVLPVISLFFCAAVGLRMVCTLDSSDDNDNDSIANDKINETQGCCSFCLFINGGYANPEELQPLYGKSKADELPNTTIDRDEKNVGERALLSKTPNSPRLAGYMTEERNIKRQWDTCMRSKDMKNPAEESIGYQEFVEHFAHFFDDIGTSMPKRLFNSLCDFNGRLTQRKLRNGIYRWGQGSMRDKLTLLFDIWDLNRNGALDKEEIRDMMTVLSNNSGTKFLSNALHLGTTDATEDQINERVEAILQRFEASLDANGDDKIILFEWLRFAEGDSDIRQFLERFTVRSF